MNSEVNKFISRNEKLQIVIIFVAIIYYSLVLLGEVNSSLAFDFVVYSGLIFVVISRIIKKEQKMDIVVSFFTIIPFFLMKSDVGSFFRFISLAALMFGYFLSFLRETLIHKSLLFVIIVILNILYLGTIGFYKFEGFSLVDSFWLTFISATTVGYGDIVAVTFYGRIITIFIVITGTIMLGAVLTTLVLNLLQKKRYKSKLENSREKIKVIEIAHVFKDYKRGNITINDLENTIIEIVEEKNDRSK